MMDRLFMFLATGFGVGYLPKAPGTWGSLLALPIHFFLVALIKNPAVYAIVLLAIFFVAVFSAGAAEKIVDFRDPSIVVIDEIIGMLIALIGAPKIAWVWLLGFLLFRFFDVLKPFPIRFFDENFHGGLGIVLDDVVSGVIVLALLQAIYRLFLP